MRPLFLLAAIPFLLSGCGTPDAKVSKRSIPSGISDTPLIYRPEYAPQTDPVPPLIAPPNDLTPASRSAQTEPLQAGSGTSLEQRVSELEAENIRLRQEMARMEGTPR